MFIELFQSTPTAYTCSLCCDKRKSMLTQHFCLVFVRSLRFSWLWQACLLGPFIVVEFISTSTISRIFFLFEGEPNTAEASAADSIATSTFHNLRVPIATHKTEGPSTSITFLGIVIDTVALELRLPQNKLLHLQEFCFVLERDKQQPKGN